MYICFPFYDANYLHLLGIILFEKFGIAIQNRTFLDKLIVNFIVANIVLLAPTGILMIYRNLVGPFDNLNISIVTVVEFYSEAGKIQLIFTSK